MLNLIKFPFIFIVLALSQTAQADALRDRIQQRFEALKQVSENTNVIHDVSYGDDPLQRMDVYTPKNAKNAPVILMVHGGAWRYGDKTAKDVIANKVSQWLPKGYVFISVNYRMLPSAKPEIQVQDITQALLTSQKLAAGWGGDANKIILMGHSAGAHLVSLIAADPDKAIALGAKPWLGTISLDSAALDLPEIMSRRHFPLYDDAFGKDSTFWQDMSPLHQLKAGAKPYLLVCSTRRELDSCDNAQRFAEKAKKLNIKATVLAEDLSHMEINEQLGLENDYTKEVRSFIKDLLPAS